MNALARKRARAPTKPAGAGVEPLVTIRGLSVRKGRPAFDFDLYAGEIVGVGGLEGHGQVAFLECVAGSRRPFEGAVHARNAQIRSERDAARSKIAFLPCDRKTEGILAPLSILDNVTISSLNNLARWGVLRWGDRNQLADDVCAFPGHRVSERVLQGSRRSVETGRRAACLHPFIVVRDGLFPSHGLLVKSVIS